jgi:hypothetical protein
MDRKTPPGKARFLYYLGQVQEILEKTARSEHPALAAYEANLRTPLFMLEALTRLYKKIHNPSRFSKLNILFKELEDKLGAIDFYDGFRKEFQDEPKIPEEITGYLHKRMKKKLKVFKRALKKEKWAENREKGLSVIIKKLDDIDWLDEQEDTAEIREIYRSSIARISEKYKSKGLECKDVETDVHELRRELRWLSIYPQALCGLTQLKTDDFPGDFLKKYLTPEIIHSAYNVMPDGGKLSGHILLNDIYFYALSWMIAELGKLKDSGLRIIAMEESLISVYKMEGNVEQLAYWLCGENQPAIPEILTRSQNIARTFFEENILENIVN